MQEKPHFLEETDTGLRGGTLAIPEQIINSEVSCLGGILEISEDTERCMNCPWSQGF